MLIFDIETAGLDDVTLARLCPEFTPPPRPGEFDPASVKYGNTKDESKRAAILAEAFNKHECAATFYDKDVKEAAQKHFAAFKDKAALDATTGRVLAIGFQAGHDGPCSRGKFAIEDGGGDEAKLLASFWTKYTKCRATAGGPRKLVGWNIHGFDLPFLIKRSWFHGIDIPQTVMDANWRYWDSLFVDLMPRFCVGQWKGMAKLDTAAKFFAVGEKPADVTGADFAKLWGGTAEERNQAVEYLKNDLAMTAAVAKRLGVV